MAEPRSIAYAGLPDSVAAIATVIGLPATLELVTRLAGCQVDLPVHRPAEALVKIIGPDLEARIRTAYAGQRSIYIPACARAAAMARNQAIHESVQAAERSMPTRQAVTLEAQRWRVSERHIWRILSRPQTTSLGPQYELPL